ncbi:MAG TPA: UbiA family prenyltransferase [Longimicrobiaceae bacterium]|nr:UbiA family prenyltransferase [Longimicrobiaceae bacterium]
MSGGRALRAVRAPLSFLARWNLLLALGMTAFTAAIQALAGTRPEPLAPLVVFLTLYSIYTVDRVADSGADALTHPERASFSRTNARLMRRTAIAAYALALAAAWAHAGPRGTAAALLPLGAVLLYSFPFLPPRLARRAGFSRLKEVLVLKNVVVAATLAATATLQVALGGAHAPAARATLAAAGAFLFGRWWINSLTFDLRDEEGDRANGIRTVPVVLGRTRTLRLLHGGNALVGAATLAAPLLLPLRPEFALLAWSSVYAWAYLRALGAGGDPHFLCDVVADGELLVLAAVVLPAAL